MADRYFVASPIVGNSASLEGAEAHHLLHVMRAKAGDKVVVFDGSDAEFVAQISKVGRSSVELAVLSRAEISRETAVRITVGVALPKGDRQKWLIEKLTELGVASVVPLETARGVAQPLENALDRLRRAVIEASKQCGRNRLLEVAAPQSVKSFLEIAADGGPRWFAHPGGTAFADEIALWRSEPRSAASVRIAIGPEGGFVDAEREQALAAGWREIDLGGRILRVETAAIALSVAAGALSR